MNKHKLVRKPCVEVGCGAYAERAHFRCKKHERKYFAPAPWGHEPIDRGHRTATLHGS